MEYRQVQHAAEKQHIARQVLENLQDWFAIEETREQYIRDSAAQPFFCAMYNHIPVGFLCLKETGKATVELAVMGVHPEYHRKGVGRGLFDMAKACAKDMGYSFMQVKTVKMGIYEDYDRTNLFYLSLGFQELEVLPIWDEQNPCQIYIMAL